LHRYAKEECKNEAEYITNLDFMLSIPLLRGGRGCVWVFAVPDTPLPLSRGDYIKSNVVM